MATVTREAIRKALKSQAFQGHTGRAVVQRTIEYLRHCSIVFNKDVASLHLNLPEGKIHDYDVTDRSVLGARRFLYQNVPQLKFRNPQVPFHCTADKSIPSEIRIKYNNGTEHVVEIKDKSPPNILQEVVRLTTEDAESIQEDYDNTGQADSTNINDNHLQ